MPVKALSVLPDGNVALVSVGSVAGIRKRMGVSSVDNDYNKQLGVFVFYEFRSDSDPNVFPSFLMQGAYFGEVVIVGDLDRNFERTRDFRSLPSEWFSASLHELIALANNDESIRQLVESYRPK